jgi:coproporphyrinogen III oxidase-like Fe-S oxidoreductase
LPNEIDKLLNNIFSNFKFSETSEITFEINPINITKQKLEVLKKYPVNRISM